MFPFAVPVVWRLSAAAAVLVAAFAAGVHWEGGRAAQRAAVVAAAQAQRDRALADGFELAVQQRDAAERSPARQIGESSMNWNRNWLPLMLLALALPGCCTTRSPPKPVPVVAPPRRLQISPELMAPAEFPAACRRLADQLSAPPQTCSPPAAVTPHG